MNASVDERGHSAGRPVVVVLLTWPTWGAWLPGPARGGQVTRFTHAPEALPAPDEGLSRTRRRGLVWPAVRLEESQRGVVIEDFRRVASFRDFEIIAAVAHPDHVHLLLRCDASRDLRRLVQLVKGAASRALSRSAGDVEADSTHGRPLPHHKWWTRQSSILVLDSDEAVEGALALLRTHARNKSTTAHFIEHDG